MRDIKKVVVLGANGTMGAGSAEVFAAGGCKVVLLARSAERAQEGLTGAQNMAKSVRIGDLMSVGNYDGDFDKAVGEADLIFEALAEDLELKKKFFARVDKIRRPDSLVATVSSGLSITEMARPCSPNFRKNFLGIHLFNPPNVIVGTEVIPHAETDPTVLAGVVDALQTRFGREVIVCRDMPAFAGNRVGFKVLNEVAQIAEKHGVAFADYLIGPYTGRAMPPLATVDLVGWDVHKAIIDNVYANTKDEAHAAFAIPGYMNQLIESGHLGNKTADKGGFYRRVKDGSKTTNLVLDPSSREYKPAGETKVAPLPFVEKMRELNRIGCYEDALKVFVAADGDEAKLARKVIFGYVSYGLNRVGEGEVVAQPRDVDRIMGFGFNWAPPSVLVDVVGAEATVKAIEAAGLAVPRVLKSLKPGVPLFRERGVNIGRFFAA